MDHFRTLMLSLDFHLEKVGIEWLASEQQQVDHNKNRRDWWVWNNLMKGGGEEEGKGSSRGRREGRKTSSAWLVVLSSYCFCIYKLCFVRDGSNVFNSHHLITRNVQPWKVSILVLSTLNKHLMSSWSTFFKYINNVSNFSSELMTTNRIVHILMKIWNVQKKSSIIINFSNRNVTATCATPGSIYCDLYHFQGYLFMSGLLSHRFSCIWTEATKIKRVKRMLTKWKETHWNRKIVFKMLIRASFAAMFPLAMSAICFLSTSSMALTEFDEISDKYCEPENVSEEVMVAIEQCYQLSSIDFKVCKNNVVIISHL